MVNSALMFIPFNARWDDRTIQLYVVINQKQALKLYNLSPLKGVDWWANFIGHTIDRFFSVGELSGDEAKVLIKNSLEGLSMLCNTIILASATILTLLLTLLGLSTGSKLK